MNSKNGERQMGKDYWKIVTVDVEPRGKAFKIGLEPKTKVKDVIKTLIEHCRDEDIDIDNWAKMKVGEQHPEFVIIRKSTMELLPPEVTFEELTPPIEEGEEFAIDVRAEVGF